MRKVIIGFSRPKAHFIPFAWLIMAIEKTNYSHVFIRAHSESLDTDLIYQASGLQVNFMGPKYFDDRESSIYEFEAEVPDETYKAFMQWAIMNSGYPYSLKQALGIGLVRVFNLKKNPFVNDKKSWVCSELAGYVLSKFLDISISADALDTAGPSAIFDLCVKYFKQVEVKNGK
jgi:hypothetical protein